MTRMNKRFVKLCMAAGYTRNDARRVTRWVKNANEHSARLHNSGESYAECYYVDVKSVKTRKKREKEC